MNLVRSGTKQPQWIFFSAEDKARHFCICTIRFGQNIHFRRRISVSVQFPIPSPSPGDRPGGQILLESTIIQIWFG